MSAFRALRDRRGPAHANEDAVARDAAQGVVRDLLVPVQVRALQRVRAAGLPADTVHHVVDLEKDGERVQ